MTYSENREVKPNKMEKYLYNTKVAHTAIVALVVVQAIAESKNTEFKLPCVYETRKELEVKHIARKTCSVTKSKLAVRVLLQCPQN